jgi:hypothetical protein
MAFENDYEAIDGASVRLHQNGNGNGNGIRANKPSTNGLNNTNGTSNPLVPPRTTNGEARRSTEKLPSLPENTNTNNTNPLLGSLGTRDHSTENLAGLSANRATSNNANKGQIVLNGTLAAFSPSSILSLLNIQKQTGALHLTQASMNGYVYVENGEVWDAKLGTVIGAYALFQLFGWKQGQFNFEVNGMSTPRRTIEATLPVLQVRATLWLDSWNKYNQLVPSMAHRIVIANDPPGEVVIEPYQWAVLTKIVTKPLSIAQLAEELDQDLMTIARIAADLVRVGVAVVKPPENS